MKRDKEQIDLIRIASQQLNYNPLSIRKRDWKDWESNVYNPQEWDGQQLQEKIKPWSSDVTGLYANIDASDPDNDYDPTSFFEGLSDFTLVGEYEAPQTDHIRENTGSQILRNARNVETYGMIRGQNIATKSERVSIHGAHGITIGRQSTRMTVEDSVGADIAPLTTDSYVVNCYGGMIGHWAEDTDISHCVAEHTIGECAENTDLHNSIGRRMLETAHDSVATHCVADKLGGQADGVPINEDMPGRVYAKECIAGTYGPNVMVAQEKDCVDDRLSFKDEKLPSRSLELPGDDILTGRTDRDILDEYEI